MTADDEKLLEDAMLKFVMHVMKDEEVSQGELAILPEMIKTLLNLGPLR